MTNPTTQVTSLNLSKRLQEAGVKDTCLRCGADKKETRRLGGECSLYSRYYGRHQWGVWNGKTVTIKI